MPEILRKYLIETRRWNGEFDQWITDNEHIKLEDRYIRFFPTEGENKGKKMYLTFDNIHIIREL